MILEEKDPTQTGGQEAEQLSPEEQIAQRVHEEQSVDFQQFDEDTGTVVPKEKPEPTEPELTAADFAPAEVESKPEPVETPATRKVKVYGEEEEVPVDVLLEHGIRNYQKDRAADIKLQNAARKEREADERLASIQGLPQGAPQQAPSRDAPEPPAESIDARLERIVYNRETERAGAAFRKDFPDIASDPHLMNMAYQLEQERLATVAALGESYGDPFETYRAHGETIRKWVKKFSGDKPVVSEDKLEKKRTITAVPAINAKPPTPQAVKVQTNSEIIDEMRRERVGRPLKR